MDIYVFIEIALSDKLAICIHTYIPRYLRPIIITMFAPYLGGVV
jgi:hypothetical protein